MTWVMFVMFAVSVFRLHEIAPPIVLKVLRPGVLAGPVGVTLMLLLAGRDVRTRLFAEPMFRWMILIFAWAILGVPFALYKSLALETVILMISLIYLVAGVLLLPRSVKSLERVSTLFAVCGGLLAIAALTVGEDSGGRLGVTQSLDPNDLGALMATCVPFALGRATRGSWLTRIISIGAAAVMSVVLMKTGSRGSTIGLVAGATAFALLRPGSSRPIWIGLVAAMGAVGWVTATPDFRARILSINDSNDYNNTEYGGRKQIWKRGMKYAAQNPILGVGAGNFPIAEGGALTDARTTGKWSAAHNMYVQALAELGLVGGSFLIAMLLYGLRSALKWSSLPGEKGRVSGRYYPEIFSGLLALAVSAVFLSLAYSWALYALLGLAGLSGAVYKSVHGTGSDRARGARRGYPSRGNAQSATRQVRYAGRANFT